MTPAAAIVALAALTACDQGDGAPDDGRPDLSERPRQANAFSDDFESGTLDAWTAEAGGGNVCSVVADPTAAAGHVAAMHLEPGVLVNRGSRAEITHDNGDIPGTTAWYRWRFLVPVDYEEPFDTTGRDAEGRPLWQILGQWHDQPDVTKGETWDTFESRSPPIALGYGTLAGEPAVVVVYGVEGQEKTLGPWRLTKGSWVDVRMRIGWSTGNDGYVAVWLDGTPLTAVVDGPTLPVVDGEARLHGRNMNNAASHYLKLGLYRNPTLAYSNTVYVDDVRIGPTLESVAP